MQGTSIEIIRHDIVRNTSVSAITSALLNVFFKFQRLYGKGTRYLEFIHDSSLLIMWARSKFDQNWRIGGNVRLDTMIFQKDNLLRSKFTYFNRKY